MLDLGGFPRRKTKLGLSLHAERLAGLIDAAHEQVLAAGDDPGELGRTVLNLESVVLGAPPDPVLEIETLARVSPGQLADFQEAYCRWETALEARFARDVRSGLLTDLNAYPLAKRFRGLIRGELVLLPETPRSVLFIGSGPTPVSALMLHESTGATVTCVDHDAEAVEASRRLVARLRPGAIRVVDGTGERVDAGGFDAVVVALLAKPKETILANLRGTMGPRSQLLCRTSTGLRTLLYEPPGVRLSRHFEVVNYRTAEGDQTISTALLRPPAAPAPRGADPTGRGLWSRRGRGGVRPWR